VSGSQYGIKLSGWMPLLESTSQGFHYNESTRSNPPDFSNNTVHNNIVTGCEYGISIEITNGSTFTSNTLKQNDVGLSIYFDAFFIISTNNTIFHNNFVENTVQATVQANETLEFPNIWDNGYEGNYWSNYNGTDSDGDGIGDTPYIIDANNTDHYPLMGMFSDFQATSEHNVQTICNSSISGFNYNGSTINFEATGEEGTAGFCRITIPTALMNETYRIFVNGTEISHTKLPVSNSTHSYLYFIYDHSTKEVTIIPEFSSFIILPLLMLATLLAVLVYRREKSKA